MDKDERVVDIHSGLEEPDYSSELVDYTDETEVETKPEASTDDEKSTESESKKKLYASIYDLVSVVMSSFIIIAVIFVFVFRLVGVSGKSMTNTLQDGDWLITVQKPEYVAGDIVVITQDTWFHEPLIKRVIATEGQVIDIDTRTDTVYVDGEAIEEPYLREDFINSAGDQSYPYTVPEGHLFCMGDNRNGSTDSRSSLVGPIDERYILGKAVLRLLPFGDFDIYDYE